MPSGLLSNLNLSLSFGLHKAIRVNLSPIALSRICVNRRTMAASGSIATSGDLVVDNLVSNSGSFSTFVKSSGVYFNDRTLNNCRRSKVTNMRNGEAIVFNFKQRSSYSSSPPFLHRLTACQSFSSSSCYSDGTMSPASTDESISAEQLSSLALSTEQKSLSYSTLKLVSGACYMPHPAKVETGGEDAHFICSDKQVIGVADGVGGWADVGVNAGLYARELMSHSVKAIQEATNSVDPLLVLEAAHAKTKAQGSSTACIIALKNQGLHAINLGDSGFIVIRDGYLIFESPVQQHGFNFTYQLECGNQGDVPSSGQVFEIPVVPGDVVVAGSDGLFDNLYNKEIAAIVADAVKESLSPDAMARKIADIARDRALDRKHPSPFSTAAHEAGYTYYGGKLDDLTVVVSYIFNA